MSDLRAPTFQKFVRTYPEYLGVAKRGDPLPPVITLSVAACDLVADLTKRYRAEQLAPLAPPPFEAGWIEWEKGPIGNERVAMSIGVARQTGEVDVIIYRPGLEVVFMGSIRDGQICIDRASEIWPVSVDTFASFSGAEGWPDTCEQVAAFWNDWWIATSAALATPGVRSVDEQRREKRLQPVKGTQAPLVTYRCVDINIDELAGIPEQAASGGAGEEGRFGIALHHVRGHLRLTEKKGLIPVRPHWRGSAEFGVRLRDHNIMRDEEMH